MRRRVPPFLTSKKGLVGACLTFYGALQLALNVLQDIEYLISHAGSIAGFIASPGGNAVILVGGIFLLVWAALSGPPGVVARLENKGPVSIEEWAPDEIEVRPNEIVCVIPYKDYDTTAAFFDDPAITIEVAGTEDVYLIVVDYEVRGENNPPPEGEYPMQIDVAVQALSEDGEIIRREYVPPGVAWVQEDGSWRHVVHENETLSGLPEGVCGLNMLEYIDVPPDFRKNARREYRDMRLTVRRIAS